MCIKIANYSSLYSDMVKPMSDMSPVERYKTCVITGQMKRRKPKIDPKTETINSYLYLFVTIKYRDDKIETGCSHVSPRFRKSTFTSNGKRERERERIVLYL
jgi:hypothetical protein